MTHPSNAYLAGAIAAAQPSDNSVRIGTVVSLDGTTLKINVNGGLIDSGYLSNFVPQVGQVVAVLRESAGWLTIGPVQGPATPREFTSAGFLRETKVVTGTDAVVGTSYVNDPYLFVDLPPEGWFSIYLRITYKSLSSGLNQRFTFPSGAITWNGAFDYDPGTDEWQTLASTISPGLSVVGLANSASAGGLAEVPLIIHGTIQMAGVAGRLQWQRAQTTAVGTTDIFRGSYLRVERMQFREEG